MLIEFTPGNWIETREVRRVLLYPCRQKHAEKPVEAVGLYFSGIRDAEHYSPSDLTQEALQYFSAELGRYPC